MTYIKKRCGKCNYTYSASVYGYVDDPIGPGLCICPSCGTIQKNKGCKEWIQLSPFKKFLAIHPRGKYSGWFLSLFAMLPFFFLLKTIGMPAGVSVFLGWFLGYALSVYLLTYFHMSSDSFRERYCDSILRTRNEDYRALLEKEGPLYDENLPKCLPCTRRDKEEIEAYLNEHAGDDFHIPTIPETVKNV